MDVHLLSKAAAFVPYGTDWDSIRSDHIVRSAINHRRLKRSQDRYQQPHPNSGCGYIDGGRSVTLLQHTFRCLLGWGVVVDFTGDDRRPNHRLRLGVRMAVKGRGNLKIGPLLS